MPSGNPLVVAACIIRSASQARSTPAALTGRQGVDSVIGPVTRPYIQVSSACTSRAPVLAAAPTSASVRAGKSARQRVSGGMTQW
jgi:hypothetical protein